MRSSDQVSNQANLNPEKEAKEAKEAKDKQLFIEFHENEWAKKGSKEKELYQYYLDSLNENQKDYLTGKVRRIDESFTSLNPYNIWFLSQVTDSKKFDRPMPFNVPPQLAELPIHFEQLRELERGYKKESNYGEVGIGPRNLAEFGTYGVFILVVLAFITSVAAATATGAYYALKRTGIAVKNICQKKKLGKSFLQLGGMAGSAYLGVIKGAVLGAAFGSSVPVIGTAVGAIIGAVCCACIGAGIAGYFSKQLGRFASWVRHKNNPKAVSKTNATKYQLPGDLVHGVDTHKMLSALRIQKNSSGQKDEYNDLLAALKTQNLIPARPLITTKTKATYKWDGILWLKQQPQSQPQQPVAPVTESSIQLVS